MFLFRGFYISVMGQIRDIMEKNVITIENDKTAQDAAKIIAEKDISFLVIMNEGKPQGVLSESDFVRKVAAEDKKASEIKISEIMSYKFRSVGPTTTIEEVLIVLMEPCLELPTPKLLDHDVVMHVMHQLPSE